jgi:phosphatidylinositol-3-phosphatase
MPVPLPVGSTPAPAAPPARASTPAPVKSTASARPKARRGQQRVTKVLVVVEENHSLAQMRSGMPYLASLAERFAYADHYTATTHPSLPNYLAIAGGDTFGVDDDEAPKAHVVHGPSVFSQATDAGLTAKTWVESMSDSCRLTPDKSNDYAVKHNPWAYFADDRASCEAGDVDAAGFVEAARSNALPNVGMLIPNTCHDAHDGGHRCNLAAADDSLKGWLPPVLASKDFTSGALAVVVTADEDDRDSGNKVLTVMLHDSLDGSHKVVSTPLTHYSLSRFCSQVVGAPPLRKAADARDLAAAFNLRVKA